MLHLVAFDSAVFNVTAFKQVNLLQSEFETISNNGVVVGKLPLIVAAKYYAAHGTRAQFQAPSLQKPDYPTIRAVMNAAPSSSVKDRWDDWRAAPVPITPGESLLAYAINGNALTEQDYILAILADKAPVPAVAAGRWVRLTGTKTLVADTWTNALMTFDDQLPYGNYDVLAARYLGASAVVGRLSFPDLNYRPPIPAALDVLTEAHPIFSIGALGVLATFLSTAQITLECLATAADTVQTLYLYIVGPK